MAASPAGSPAPAPLGPGRLVLLVTSHRVAPGLLTRDAWTLLDGAEIHVGPDAAAQRAPLAAAGLAIRETVREPGAASGAAEAAELLARARGGGLVVRVTGADGAPDLARALADAIAGLASSGGAPPLLEVLHGSYDLPGARLLDLVAVMDRLRSPGGCPWDAEQTHSSLLTYLLEEAYETVEAVEAARAGESRAHLREELGDLLLQVAFHARIAAEHPTEPFGIDEVAAGIVDKLISRHPHVFPPAGATGEDAGGSVPGAAATREQVESNWEALKKAEKGRTSSMDGVPLAQPALALAAKLQHRAARAGVAVPAAPDPDADVGEALFALVGVARARGLDPEAELRAAARRFAAAVRAAEQGTGH